MNENKNILIGGLAILAGAPIVLAIAWALWTYWWANILVWVVIIYAVRNYDSNFMQGTKSWWITKRRKRQR